MPTGPDVSGRDIFPRNVDTRHGETPQDETGHLCSSSDVVRTTIECWTLFWLSRDGGLIRPVGCDCGQGRWFYCWLRHHPTQRAQSLLPKTTSMRSKRRWPQLATIGYSVGVVSNGEQRHIGMQERICGGNDWPHQPKNDTVGKIIPRKCAPSMWMRATLAHCRRSWTGAVVRRIQTIWIFQSRQSEIRDYQRSKKISFLCCLLVRPCVCLQINV
jgi:hypothetical protein